MDVLEMPVTLIVKAPNQQIEDQVVKCEPTWSIKKLKGYLSEVYPSKPKTEEQKLIYSGRLLSDHLTLKDVLRSLEEQTTHTVHLVCNHGSTRTTTMVEDPPVNSGVRRRRAGEDEAERRPEPQPTAAPPTYPTPEQWNQHMLQIQQYYAQYMQQYQYWQQMQAATVPMASTSTTTATTVSPQPEPVPQANQQPQQDNRNMQMDAQGGMMAVDDDDEGGERQHDLLYWFYLMSRALVLFSIVYFYSTPVRFLCVTAVGMLLYLYQMWRRLRHDEQAREQVQQARQQEVPRPEEQPPQQEPEEREGEEAEAPQEPADNTRADVQQYVSPWATASTFVYSLFTSLFPDIPAELNQ